MFDILGSVFVMMALYFDEWLQNKELRPKLY